MDTARKLLSGPRSSQLHPFWRGQLFLFNQPPAPAYTPQQGYRLLLIFFVLELSRRPLFAASAQWLSVPRYSWWSQIAVGFLTLLVCFLVTKFAGLRLSQLGLYSWRRWSITEKFYFLQIVPIAIIVFSFFNSASLTMLWRHSDLWRMACLTFVFEMIWGFYQEFLYRGVLQTELVRRWGPNKGILASNLAFTFGPLHAYHFLAAARNPSHLWIFAAIFAIGLLFAILLRRSGNLWIIAVMHGLGDWFMDGLAKIP
jgi:CAAX protease family protein